MRHKVFFLFKDDEGLTLLEIVVSMAVFSLLALALSTLFTVGLRHWEGSTARTEASQGARAALDHMLEELRYAEEVEIPGEVPEDLSGEIFKESIIRYQLPGDSLNNYFYRDGGEIVKEEYQKNGEFNSHQKIALNVSRLSFVEKEGGTVEVKVEAGEVGLKSAVAPRNTP